MSNVFYDRSGKPHTIKSKKTESSEKPSKPGPSGKKKPSPKSPTLGVKKSESKFSKEPGRKDKSKSGFKSKPGSRFEKRPRPERGPSPQGLAQTLKATVDMNKKGTAYLIFESKSIEDAFLPKHFLDQVFHGDRVEIKVADGRIQSVKVLEHRFKEIFGRIRIQSQKFSQKGARRTGVLVYERKKTRAEIWVGVLPEKINDQDWVHAKIHFDHGKGEGPWAEIIEIIGPEIPASYDIAMVAGEFNLKEHHTPQAVKEAEAFKLDLNSPDLADRTDLRHLPFITIDGETARDFDDAVYVERLKSPQSYRLWVAIADVSHYVKAGTVLDAEAYERATSVYFPERAFHMLPRALSEDLCSLKPRVPRLSMACSIDFDDQGNPSHTKMYSAIIESRRRATYTEIEAEKNDPQHADLFALYRILRQARTRRGSVDFDFPESEIHLNETTGEPLDIFVRERNDAHRLIEEFMIAANEATSRWMIEKDLPFIYRIHEEPSTEAMERFKKMTRTQGIQFFDRGRSFEPKVLTQFLESIKGHPAEGLLAQQLLRSMKQAVYSAHNIGHFGLASKAYSHFTSPIRRYPDLIAHRLLREALETPNLTPRGSKKDERTTELEQQAEHCSYRERVAADAERESKRFKQIRMMGKHLGEEFEGSIVGMNERGFFVQINRPYCDGFVPVDTIEDDYYIFNEDRMLMYGRRKKRTFTIGQKVQIKVARVDLDARQIEFTLK